MTTTKTKAKLLAATLLATPIVAGFPTGAAQALTVGSTPAETLTLSGAVGTVRSDSTAQGLKLLRIWSNGSASGSVSVGTATDAMVVRAKGDQCSGAPQMRVSVDGRPLSTMFVTSTTWTDVRIPVSVAVGSRTVTIAFMNDYRTTSCDRNLDLDTITFTAPTPTSSATGTVVFDASVAAKGLSAYTGTQNANRISIVNDPVLGDRRKVMRFTVYDTDDQLTGNPRAQVETAKFWSVGSEHYIGVSYYFPSDFPMQQDTKQWVNLGEVYGPPYAGASPNGLFVKRVSTGGQVITWQRNGTYAWDRPFELPLVKGRWYDFVFRINLSTDPTVGFWEVWSNTGGGWQRVKLHGQDRLYSKTVDSSNNGGANYDKLAHYRSKGMWPVATHYAAEHRIGSSFAAVAPHSYP